MPAPAPFHLVTGADERRRRWLVDDLARSATPPSRVLTWGSGLLEAPGRAEDATALAPAAVRQLEDTGRELLAALDLPTEVAHDLTASLRDPVLLALLGAGRVLAEESALVLVAPVEADPARLVGLPARTARTARSLVPVAARWDALVAPPGVGELPRPQPAVLDALREVAELLEPLDRALTGRAALHHLPGAGIVESGRTADLTVALALMGRTLVDDGLSPTTADDTGRGEPTGPGLGPPFVLRVPLPGLSAGEIVLEREGDDLVISAGRHSRSTRLSGMHRRCVITDASMRQGVLTLELEPDEGEWPR